MKDLQALLDAATPGDWEAAIERGCHGVIASSLPEGGANFIAIVGNDSATPEREPERFANARLMAKARSSAERVLELEAAILSVIDGDDCIQRGEIFRDDGVHSKHDNCIHGLPVYNGCEACVCEFLSKALKGGTS